MKIQIILLLNQSYLIMKKLFILLISLFAFSTVETITAQEQDNKPTERYYELRFRNNMYISLGGGINLYMTKEIPGYNDNRPITGLGSFAVGKWLTPYVGLRMEVNGSPVKIMQQSLTQVDQKSTMYLGLYGDFMWNISNTIAGYNPRRVVDFIPFAGISFMKMVEKNFDDNKPFAFPMSAGLKMNFRLSHYVDLFLQGRFTFTPDHFDGRAGNQLEPMLAAQAGITIKFGKNRFTPYNPYLEQLHKQELNEMVNVMRAELAECRARICPEPEVQVEERVVIKEYVTLSTVIKFGFNSDYITPDQQLQVYLAAEWMKANEGNINIVGYADADTGTSQYNEALGMRRAQAVADALVNTYDIDINRLNVISKGSSQQLFKNDNNWNRVVVIEPAE